MIQLNYRDPRPIYEQVKDGIRKLAYSGMIGPDEKLPSVRELASRLAINPNTISRAYKELEQEGFLYSMTGRGTFINVGFDLNDRRKEELYQKFDKVVKELLAISIPIEELKNRMDELEEKHGKSSLNMVHSDMQLKGHSQTDENCQVKATAQSKEDTQSKEDMQSKKDTQLKEDMQSKKDTQSKEDMLSKKDMQLKEDMLSNKMKESSRRNKKEVNDKNQEGGSIDDSGK